MHSFCLLTSMELNFKQNYSLLYLHSNYKNSLKNLLFYSYEYNCYIKHTNTVGV